MHQHPSTIANSFTDTLTPSLSSFVAGLPVLPTTAWRPSGSPKIFLSRSSHVSRQGLYAASSASPTIGSASSTTPITHRKLPQTLARFLYTRSDNGRLPLETQVRFASVSRKCCPPVDTSFTFLCSHRRVDLLGYCNGLLLCRWYDVSAPDDEFCYIVCNPAREEWVKLPDISQADNVRALHLGFDPAVSAHFYVFALLEDVHFIFYLAEVEVYSPETRKMGLQGNWMVQKN